MHALPFVQASLSAVTAVTAHRAAVAQDDSKR